MPKNSIHKSRVKKIPLIPEGGGIASNTVVVERTKGTSITTVKGNGVKPSTDSFRMGDFGCKIKLNLSDRLMDVDDHFDTSSFLFDIGDKYIYSMRDVRNILQGNTGNKGLDDTLERDDLFLSFLQDCYAAFDIKDKKQQKGYSDFLAVKYCTIPKGINTSDSKAIAGYRALVNRLRKAITYLTCGRVDITTATMWNQGSLTCTSGFYRGLYYKVLRQRDLIRQRVRSNNDNRLKIDLTTGEFKKIDGEEYDNK